MKFRFRLIIIFIALHTYSRAQFIVFQSSEDNKNLTSVRVIEEGTTNVFVTDSTGRINTEIFKYPLLINIIPVDGIPLRVKINEKPLTDFIIRIQPVNTPVRLNEVYISANRWKESETDLPGYRINLKPSDAQIIQPQTMADFLGSSGQVFIQKSQYGGGSPMIRGFSANRLLYVVDGIRMNSAIYRSGNLQNVISIDPFAIERTEVQFGPSSVMYGSDAIGGVVSFVTLKPEFSRNIQGNLNGSATLRFSSASSERTGHLHLKYSKGRFAGISSVTVSDFGDLRTGKNGPTEYLRTYYSDVVDGSDLKVLNDNPLIQKPTGYSQMNVMQKMRFNIAKGIDIHIDGHYSRTGNIPRYDRLTRFKNGLPQSAEWYYGPQVWSMIVLGLSDNRKRLISDGFIFRGGWQRSEESRITRNFNSTRRLTSQERVDAYSFNLDANKKIGSKIAVYFGTEYILNLVNSNAFLTQIKTGIKETTAPRYPKSSWHSVAFYLSGEYQIQKKVLISASARYNHFILKSKFNQLLFDYPFSEFNYNKGAGTGAIGLIYKPGKSWVLSFLANTAFRAPNVDDTGKLTEQIDGFMTVPNANLNPEYAYNAELTLSKVFTDRIRVQTSFYYTYLNGALVRRSGQYNGSDSIVYNGDKFKVLTIQNAAFARVYGFQVSLNMCLTRGLYLQSDFNYQKGIEEMEDGSRSTLRHAAPIFGQTSIVFYYGYLQLRAYSQYSGGISYENLNVEERLKPELYARNSDGKPYSPSWYTINLKASYTIRPLITIIAGIENITDIRYRTYSSGISAAGRNVILSLQSNF